MTDKRLLIVDDEEDICAILKYNLEKAGYVVDTDVSAENALTRDLSQYSLVLLDVMMGEISGLEMASRIRSDAGTCSLPIIFITAKDTADDAVAGFDAGADDYISKPFSVKEVISRVAAVLRRCSSQKSQHDDFLTYKEMLLDNNRKSLVVEGRPIEVTKTEFELLHLLVSAPGKVFSREQILSAVWPNDTVVVDRTVDVNITRLRKKISPYGANIVTRHGYGYCFVDET